MSRRIAKSVFALLLMAALAGGGLVLGYPVAGEAACATGGDPPLADAGSASPWDGRLMAAASVDHGKACCAEDCGSECGSCVGCAAALPASVLPCLNLPDLPGVRASAPVPSAWPDTELRPPRRLHS